MRAFRITLLVLVAAAVVSAVPLMRVLSQVGGLGARLLHDWAALALVIITAWGLLRLIRRHENGRQ